MKTLELTSDHRPDPLLDVDDLIETLRIGRSQVYELLRSGRLRSLKLGTQWRVTRAQLEESLTRQSEGAA